MIRCQYEARAGSQGCPNERTMDFAFCIVHMNTPRGRQHAQDVIARGELTLPSQVEAAIAEAREVPDVDYQTSALEKMSAALDVIEGWVMEARRNLDSLGGPDQWRFTDRAGQEQQHTFLGVYERAIGQYSRHLASMSKAALQERIVSLGKAQVDMMIRLMMAVITELRLSNAETDRARAILLDKLTQEANLTPRLESHAAQTLSSANQARELDLSKTGGVTSVRIRGEEI